MKVRRVVCALVLILGLFQVLVSFRRQDKMPDLVVKEQLCKQLGRFYAYLQDTLQPIVYSSCSETQLQRSFLQTRQYYKSVEWAVEYFTYATAKMVNGAPKPEIEIAGRSINSPNGLQVMEEMLFPHYDQNRKKALQEEVSLLIENVAIFKTYFTNIDMASWQILDAAKLEIFRIESLGINGFDDALTLHSMEESAVALKSVQDVMYPYVGGNDSLTVLFLRAASYLNTNKDFITFDRAYFIRNYANPLSRSIEKVRRNYAHSALRYNRLLRQDAFTLFDSGAFDPMAYAPFPGQKNIPAKTALGKRLFQDPVFSGTQTRSCASCHIPEKAFANNLIKEKDIGGNGWIDRNTPTLVNTALQPQQFYDQRAENIEDQVLDVVHNPKEMNGSIAKALPLVRSSPDYQLLVRKAYPGKKELTEKDIVEALSAYVRSLVKLNSRFDGYMQGDGRAMTAAEINGFNLFMGKAQCGTCHYMPLFSGVFPPKYISQDVEVLGVPSSLDSTKVDKDRGLYEVLAQQGLYDSLLMHHFDHAFKTVSVRNATKTAPYMHNGTFATLAAVMDFYNGGGGIGKGIKIPNQTLSPDKLNLTPKETEDIIAFIGALDSR